MFPEELLDENSFPEVLASAKMLFGVKVWNVVIIEELTLVAWTSEKTSVIKNISEDGRISNTEVLLRMLGKEDIAVVI